VAKKKMPASFLANIKKKAGAKSKAKAKAKSKRK
jgi:hypothetical protein